MPSEMDRGPEPEAPPPAMHICGFKEGKVTLPGNYHTWEKAAHLAESFDMVRQRWLQFQRAKGRNPLGNGGCRTSLWRGVPLLEAVPRTESEVWVLPNQRYTC